MSMILHRLTSVSVGSHEADTRFLQVQFLGFNSNKKPKHHYKRSRIGRHPTQKVTLRSENMQKQLCVKRMGTMFTDELLYFLNKRGHFYHQTKYVGEFI